MCPGRFSLTQRIAFIKVNTVFCVCCFVLFKRRKWNRLRFAQSRRVPLFERINKLLQIICLYDITGAKRSRVYALSRHSTPSLWSYRTQELLALISAGVLFRWAKEWRSCCLLPPYLWPEKTVERLLSVESITRAKRQTTSACAASIVNGHAQPLYRDEATVAAL